jgi:subtilase family serine protease
MRRRIVFAAVVCGAIGFAVAVASAGRPAARPRVVAPAVIEAPGGPLKVQASWLRSSPGWSGCTAAGGALHCYLPSDIREAYGVNQLPEEGDGQTIVLVDSYGDPEAASELQAFHDAFFPNEPSPNFDQVFPLGRPDFKNANGNGQSGSGAAAGWAVEAALDVQWAYAIAPHAHIVLLAVPPAETLGVQGFPNLFKAISGAIDAYPAGTVFSMSLAATEGAFGGAAAVQTAKFDRVFQKGVAKGDSFFGASGDWGTNDGEKQQGRTAVGPNPAVYWPSSSPYVTSVGGTQLQFGWTWDPQSDTPFTSSGFNPDYFNSTPGGDLNVVWNESWLPAATGGGPSQVYPLPSWQSSVASVIGGDHRGLPDLSWNAAVNGAVLVDLQSFLPPDQQGFYLIGGTSAASPQVAALTALVNERRAGLVKAPVGNLAPLLYSLPSNAFTDVAPIHQGAVGVASGDLNTNAMFQYNADGSVSLGPVAGWPVLTGWDMTTGFGTPWAPSFVADLALNP